MNIAAVLSVVVDAKTGKAVLDLQKLDTTLDTTALSATRAVTGVGKLGPVATQQAKNVRALGNAARFTGKALAGGLVYAIYDTVKAGAAYEQQMDKVEAVSDATGRQMDKLGDQSLRLGARTKFSAGEAASGMFELSAAGFEIREIRRSIPGTLSLAAASGIELADAAEISANALRAFGLEADQSTHVADVLAQAVNSSSLKMQDLQYSMKYIGPIGKATGQSIETLVAALGLMGDAGIKGEQGGTTLRAGLLRLVNPIGQTKEALGDLGIEANELYGPNGLKPLPEIIALLQEKTEGMTTAERNQALAMIFGQEALSGMLTVIDAGPEKLAKLTRALEESDGVAKRQAKTMTQNVPGAWEELMGSLETVEIGLYEKFQDPLRDTILDGVDLVNTEGVKIQEYFDDIVSTEAFDDADLQGKLALLFDDVPEAAQDAIPEIAEALGEAGGKSAIYFIKGFTQADEWGKLALGTLLLSKTVGLGASAKWLGGLTAAEYLGSTGSGVKKGIGGVLGTAVRRAGLVGIGVTLADPILDEFSRKMASDSEDVFEALNAKAGVYADPSAWNAISRAFGSGGDAEAVDLYGTLKAVNEEALALTPELADQARAWADSLELTEGQRDTMEEILGLGEDRMDQLLRGAKLGIEFDADQGDLLSDKLLDDLELLRSGALTQMDDINRVMKRGMRTIGSTMERGSDEAREATASNLRGTAEAIADAIRTGAIPATKANLQRVKHLISRADLVEGIRPEEFGRAFARALARGEEVTDKKIDRIIDRFKDMKEEARPAAYDMMTAALREYKRGGDLSDKEFERIKSRILGKLGDVRTRAPNLARVTSTALSGIFGGLTGNVSTSLGIMGEDINEMLQALNVDKISYTLSKSGSGGGADKSVGGNAAARRIEGGLVPGAGIGDSVLYNVLTEPQEGLFVMNKNAMSAYQQWNDMFPRYPSSVERKAKGGAVGGGLNFALGPYNDSPIQYAADHAGSNSHVHITGTTSSWVVGIGRELQRMGFIVGEHPAFGGVNYTHSATGGHYDALAIDVNSAASLNESRAEVASIARLLGGAGGSAIAGGVGDVTKMLLKGPDGPFKDLGQAAINTVHKSMVEYLAAQTPSVTSTAGFDMPGGSGDVEKMLAKAAKLYSTSRVASLALGMAGYAESGMQDLPYGDRDSEGALQYRIGIHSIDPHNELAIGRHFLTVGATGYAANDAAAAGLPAHLVAQAAQGSFDSTGMNYLAQEARARAWVAKYGLGNGGMADGLHAVGEMGLELAHFPSGTRVHNAADSKAILAPEVDVAVFITASGGVSIDEVRSEIDGREKEVSFSTNRRKRRPKK